MKIGIDFGTTHTVVAFVDRGNYPVVAFESSNAVPSMIAVRKLDGALRFGVEALTLQRSSEWAILRSFKRLLADAGPLSEINVGGHTFSIPDLLVSFFSYVRAQLIAHSNASIRRRDPLETSISVPANASTSQRFLTIDAFRRAGFDVVRLLNEPSAAGFEYAHRFRRTITSRREHVVVYDLGGGTFDASLIHMAGQLNEVITSAGVSRLGGDDIDSAIVDLVLQRAGVGEIDEDPRAALQDDCRVAKEAVGPNTRRLTVDLTQLDRPPIVIPIEEVYEACSPLVVRSIQAMEPVVSGGGDNGSHGPSSWSEIAGIYVVGGASGFPPVLRMLRERFGDHRVRRSPHPFAATAIGLAIFLDEGSGFQISECLTRHFGVWREELRGSEVCFDTIFPKDTRIPGPTDPPLEAVRRYRAVHNVGHFRFVECGALREGRPDGDVTPWDEIRFPFEPTLREQRDLRNVSVRRMSDTGPEVEERYRCTAAGTLEVAVTVLDDGYHKTFKVARRAGRTS